MSTSPRSIKAENNNQPSQGFTLAEVMVGASIIILLVVNLQAMVVYAAMFRLKAKHSSDSRAWIQQDLENAQFKASQFSFASLTAAAAASSGSISVNRTSLGGITLAAGDNLTIGTDPRLHKVSTVGSTTVSFTPSLSVSQPIGAQVSVLGSSSAKKLCNATASSTSLAQALTADLDPVINSSKELDGVPYTLTRTATVVDTAPYQILQLSYSIAPSAGGISIMSLQTEVFSNDALSCP
jgi:hypothetical protein